ncbi:polysaccharide deacetylase family protein [Ruficoccus sp. ZRK36]|uniref:polysaccharide deacetylase family protein n=1 Tax=Ruficoccus sp. ZRK36 TaxID=2866311 RepID=UPI001C7347E6|nr:polysaccharide deacetylase family protein [Ruficoccus sp. ZRK36]QYY36088.1 polysaccharide deacetylase family protein [Ruficoccus sp. ZRK36]
MLKVVQCWDDGVHDDLPLMEILRKYGAKASFNLNPKLHKAERDGWHHRSPAKDVYRLALSELKDAYKDFTVANHTMTHPHTLQIPLEQWRAEVVDARKWLQDLFQQPILGFAYPYGDYDDATSQVVADAGHVYARTTKNATPCMPVENPLQFHADCHFLSENFWSLYEKAKASEAQVFYFWGHSYEIEGDQMWAEMEAKIKKIAEDPDAEWADLPDLFTE